MHVKCMSMFLYDEIALQRMIHGRNSCMINKNFDFCLNSTMEIFQVTTIVSPVSHELKMLYEGLALMQNEGSTYNLRTCSIH